ncbi:MAG: hypothetical protein KDJ45_12545, partial [Hyphomicrobiaceae bacterium]|nr:hypothetical protein [Hyphomicrobiaceae bacterium]
MAARALFYPMESDRRSSFLFGRIFCDEPVATSSENALAGCFSFLVALHGRRGGSLLVSAL